MRINQNIAAFNAYRNLNQTQNQLSSSLEKLSSGVPHQTCRRWGLPSFG